MTSPSEHCHDGFQPGLWSLLEMINFMVPHYMAIHKLIYQELSLAAAKMHGSGDAAVDGADKDRIRQNMQYPLQKATEYGLETSQDRIERIVLLTRPTQILTLREIERQMRALLEAFEDDTKFLYLYAYPKDKAQRFIRAQTEWFEAIKAIPTIKDDVLRATDLYALGQNLACVFHLMRVMQTGVQRFGKKLHVSLTKTSANRLTDLTWHSILDGLNPKLKAMSQKTPAAKAKFEKYTATQNYLYGVKDVWRNPTMHPRKTGYSDLEALDILNHVRSFMNELASVIAS